MNATPTTSTDGEAPIQWTAFLGLILPGSIIAGILLYIFLLHADERGPIYGALALFAFTPAGKFAATVMVDIEGVNWFDAVLLLGSWDLAFGILFGWNMDLLRRVPFFGPRFTRWETNAEGILERNTWLRRTAFVGLIALVAFPFQGTGAIIGSLVGRVMGFGPWRTTAAVAIGSFGGIAAVAAISEGLIGSSEPTGDSSLVTLLLVTIAVTAGMAGTFGWRKLQNRRSAIAETAE